MIFIGFIFDTNYFTIKIRTMFDFYGIAQALFIELYAFSLIFIIFIFNQIFYFNHKSEMNYFKYIILFIGLNHVISIIGVLINHQFGPAFTYANYFIGFIYHAITYISSPFILIFSLALTKDNTAYRRRFLFFILLPSLILNILNIVSLKTHWLFYVNFQNIIIRQPLSYYTTIYCYTYFLVSFIIVFRRHLQNKKNNNRQWYSAVLNLYFIPLISLIIFLFKPDFPISWIGFSIAAVLIYISIKFEQIKNDGLTGLHNRRQFDEYLSTAVHNYSPSYNLVLFFIDVNHFKKINDEYGHLIGDDVLVYTAKILDSICKNYNADLFRYGGDEFTIIYKCNFLHEADKLKIDIYNNFYRPKKDLPFPFQITISAGYASYNPQEMQKEKDFIEKADNSMYEAKKTMHSYLNRNQK